MPIGNPEEFVARLRLEYTEEGLERLVSGTRTAEKSFRQAHENAAKFEKGMYSLSNTVKGAGQSLQSLGNFFNAANLSLKSGTDIAYKYNQAMVATFSQFQKYGMSLKQYTDKIDNIRSTYKTTYEEAIRLTSGFEKSFNVVAPERMEMVLDSIAKTVGKDTQAMEAFLGSITAVTAQNPLLEKMLENVSGNNEEIRKFTTGLYLSGSITSAQLKSFEELRNAQNRGGADRSGFNKMQNSNMAVRQIQNTYETGLKKAGDDVLNITKSTVDFVGEWDKKLVSILHRYTEIAAVAGGLSGATSAVLNTLQSAANVRTLIAGGGSNRAVGNAIASGAEMMGLGGLSRLGMGAARLGSKALRFAGPVGLAVTAGLEAHNAAKEIDRYIQNDYGTDEINDSLYMHTFGNYKKDGSSLQQYGPSPEAAKHQEKIRAEKAKQVQIDDELRVKNELIVNTYVRQQALVDSTTQLLNTQLEYYGRTGANVDNLVANATKDLDAAEAAARARLAQIHAFNTDDDPMTKKMIQEIEGKLLDISNKRAEIAEKNVKLNEPMIEMKRSEISLTERQIGLADSAGMGLRAQVGVRKQLMDQISQEIQLQQVQLSKAQKGLQEAIASGDKNKEYKMRMEILRIEGDITGEMQKQAEVSKSMREGWIGAISAMTEGAGVFSRIVISQNARLGNLQFAGPDRLKTLTGGGVMGGRTQSARWTPGGFTEGAAGSYEKGVLDQYGITGNGSIQDMARGMMKWQQNVGSQMSPASAALVGPQGTSEVTTAVSEGFKKALSENGSKDSAAVVFTKDQIEEMKKDWIQTFANILKEAETATIKKINSGR